MIVYIVAVAAVLFYAAQVPIRFAFTILLGEENVLKLGIGVFEARYITQKQLPLTGDEARQWLPNVPRGRLLRALWRAFHRFGRHARFEGGRFSLSLGTGDAAKTAMLCAAVGALLSALRISGRVTPDFGRANLRLSAGGMVHVRAGHIMYGALGLARELAKERIRHGQTSH